jgi:hypothetical protein
MNRSKKYIIILLTTVLATSFSGINVAVFATNNNHSEEQYFLRNNINHYDTRIMSCADNSSQNTTLRGNVELEQIFNFFIDQGLSNEQAAGIVGNISQESGGNPHKSQKGPDTDDPSGKTGAIGGGNAWGIIQWDAGSRAIEYAEKANITTPIGDLSTQLELVWWHMNNISPTGAENMISEYMKIPDVEEATKAYEKHMTGAGVPRMTNRIEAAKLALKTYGTDIATSVSANHSTCDSSTGLISGGMNLQQAKSFMEEYKKLAKKYANQRHGKFTMTEYGIEVYGAGSRCAESGIANCSSFSEYFVGRFTNGEPAFPNGKDMVGALLKNDSGFIDGKHTPKVYAVFSRQSGGGGSGHTGVVLGLNSDTGKMIIGEANCSSIANGGGYAGIRAIEVSISSFSKNDYTYAYTDKILKTKGGLLST